MLNRPSIFHTDRKTTIQNRIVTEVGRFFTQYGQGMRMQILSAKYSTALKEYGGFPETMHELEQAGRLFIEVAPNGARTVKPGVVPSGGGPVQPAYWF